MKSPYQFIVKPINGTRYNNTKSISGVDFIVNTSEEDYRFSNRIAEVIETPVNYSGPISKGDQLVVHHNVFKFYNDMKGRRKSGKSFFRDDLFFIDHEQFFLYGKDGNWKAYDRYCFVKPILSSEGYLDKPKFEPLTGEMVYPNDYLKSKGISAGDLVCFAPDGEYEFEINGQKMYRMFDHYITIKL